MYPLKQHNFQLTSKLYSVYNSRLYTSSLTKTDILSVLESNKIVFGLGAASPAGGADGAPSDPLVDPFSFLLTPLAF